MNDMVLCFGSNEMGEHGGGAARDAHKNHGARWNVGFGFQGKSFAIPTCSKSTGLPGFQITPEALRFYVYCFILFAKMNPLLEFKVTRIGTGLAGWKDTEVAPLFQEAPDNCFFDTAWESLLSVKTSSGTTRKFWGTYGVVVVGGGQGIAPTVIIDQTLTLGSGD